MQARLHRHACSHAWMQAMNVHVCEIQDARMHKLGKGAFWFHKRRHFRSIACHPVILLRHVSFWCSGNGHDMMACRNAATTCFHGHVPFCSSSRPWAPLLDPKKSFRGVETVRAMGHALLTFVMERIHVPSSGAIFLPLVFDFATSTTGPQEFIRRRVNSAHVNRVSHAMCGLPWLLEVT